MSIEWCYLSRKHLLFCYHMIPDLNLIVHTRGASYNPLYISACVCPCEQNDIYEWARDHRVHHKYSETDADPHNALRGFFFSHIGWLLVRKHPDVIEKGRKLELLDLKADEVVMFQRRWAHIPYRHSTVCRFTGFTGSGTSLLFHTHLVLCAAVFHKLTCLFRVNKTWQTFILLTMSFFSVWENSPF